MSDHVNLDGETIAVMANNIDHIQKDIDSIKKTMEGSFVTLEKHNSLSERVKLLTTVVFGMVGVILIGFLTAVVNFFIQGK